MGTTDTVGAFLAGIEGASLPDDIFCDDVVLDATVPNWRFQVRGARAVCDELGTWYADLGRLGELRRNVIDNGELVEFTLSWEEAGVPHACHQAHVIKLRAHRIASDTVFCGGRWPESLVVQMEETQLAIDRKAVTGSE
jgi:hypothetical protein